MTKKSYDDMMMVVRFLDKSGIRTIFPALLDELCLPCSADYICSLKKRMAEAGYYNATKHYVKGLEYQKLVRVSDRPTKPCPSNWMNDLRVALLIEQYDTFTTSSILNEIPIRKRPAINNSRQNGKG